MKRVLFTLCMVLSTILIIAGERFTIGKYTFEITSPMEVELEEVDKSVSSVNVSPTITYQGTTYRVTIIGNYAFHKCSSLTSVKYTGTKGQWRKIKRKRWTDGSEIQVVRCTDGEIRP